jgi:hypothetical protein
MGLGLAISWMIIERHEGQLSVSSANPHGAIFRITHIATLKERPFTTSQIGSEDCLTKFAPTSDFRFALFSIDLHQTEVAINDVRFVPKADILHCGKERHLNLEPLMSALGHKRTSECVRAMSALPPKADLRTQPCDARFVPKADICGAAKSCLFDHLVGATE